MKNMCVLIFGFLLSVCLTFYGPFGMALAGSGAAFSMEICADGVAKTVVVDADGIPLAPAQNCPDCSKCCQAIGTLTPMFGAVAPSYALLGVTAGGFVAAPPIFNFRNLFPAPRGPPTMHISLRNTPIPNTGHRSDIRPMMRCGGRPMLKDANA